MAQLQAIRADVYELMGYSTSDGRLTSTHVDLFINMALRRYANRHVWPWLVDTDSTNTATVAGTGSYSVPSDHIRTLSVTVDDNSDLQAVLPRQFVTWGGREGFPAYYTVEQSLLKLAPTPSDAWTLVHEYLKTEPTISGDTDTPLIPDAHLDIVLWGAAQYGHTRLKDWQAAREAKNEFTSAIREASDAARPYMGGVLPLHRTDWSDGV